MSIERVVKEAVKAAIQSGNTGGIWYQVAGEARKAAIQQAMEETRNNQSQAAAILGFNRATLRTAARNTMTPDELREVGML